MRMYLHYSIPNFKYQVAGVDSLKITGIIAEYNPFHNGHAYHLRRVRRSASHIVCVLGGHFTQRGDLALLDKWTRAEAALWGGCDLVIDLPLPWSMAPAERFAAGGVALLEGLGCVDQLHFGSESGRLSILQRTADALLSPAIAPALHTALADGTAFAAARQQAVAAHFGRQTAQPLRDPNNILALSYLAALRDQGSSIQPQTIRRHGASHDSLHAGKKIASASYLRKLAADDLSIAGLRPYVPEASYELLHRAYTQGRIVTGTAALEQGLLARLRMLDTADFTTLPDLSEGLENRLHQAVLSSTSWDELIHTVKVKRYPLARIRRLCLSAALGLTAAHCAGTPPYIRVLGMNERGQEILRLAKTTARLPIYLRAADLARADQPIRDLFALENRATDLYALACLTPLPCAMEYTRQIVRHTSSGHRHP